MSDVYGLYSNNGQCPLATGANRPMGIGHGCLYIGHALGQGPPELYSYTALYSAVEYTAIHHYTLYTLYNTPLRESRRGWGQQLVVRGQLHSPMGKLVMRVAHVAPIRARCFNSKRTSFHVALELEHVESVDLRSAIRKADAVLPAFAREGQRGHTVKRVARRGRCRLLFLLGVQHIVMGVGNGWTDVHSVTASRALGKALKRECRQ